MNLQNILIGTGKLIWWLLKGAIYIILFFIFISCIATEYISKAISEAIYPILHTKPKNHDKTPKRLS